MNMKGGNAKTTTANAIAAGLRREGKRVLAIDADPQANLSIWMGADPNSGARGLYDVIAANRSIRKSIQNTPQGPIIAADSRLTEKGLLQGRNSEYRIREALTNVADDYDATVIDCAPGLSTLTYAALTAADGVVIPCKADRFSMDALGQIAATLNTVKANSNKRLTVYGILIVMYERRPLAQRLMKEQIERQAAALDLPVFATPIRKSTGIQEAQITGDDIYTTNSSAAQDYGEIIKELLDTTRL